MQKTIKLNSGFDMPTLGLGTWKSEPNKVGEAVKYAIMEAGYKHIDGAAVYGNESEIGKVYAEIFKTIKREEIFITSKLWNSSHAKDQVEKACRQTLKDLNLEYLDLYLMHWGVSFPEDGNTRFPNYFVPIRETWEAMEQLVAKGLVKSIGVANFTGMMLVDLHTYATIKPAINQVEMHPYNSQSELLKFCETQNIVVTAYSPLGRQGASDVIGPRLFDDPTIVELSQKYARPMGHILLSWALSRGTIVIPKSVTPSRIKENISVYDFEMSVSDLSKIDQLNQNYRFVDPSQWWGIPCFK